MFAVDTYILYLNSNINKLCENVKKELATVTNWCVANTLSINTSKTNSMYYQYTMEFYST